MKWQCNTKRCGDCLSTLTHNEETVDFAVRNISRLRRQTFDHPEHKTFEYIGEELTKLLRLSKSTLQYVVSGVRTCKSAWAWAHGFSSATCNRAHAVFNRWWQSANPDIKTQAPDSSVGRPQHTVDYWVYRWLMLATHNPPNGTQGSVPKLGSSVLHPQYVEWCARAKEDPVTIDNFRSRLNIIKKQLDLATRKSKKGSAECDVCSILKRAEAKAIGLSAKGQISQLLAEHIQFTNSECNVYFQHGFEAKDNPTQVIVHIHTHKPMNIV